MWGFGRREELASDKAELKSLQPWDFESNSSSKQFRQILQASFTPCTSGRRVLWLSPYLTLSMPGNTLSLILPFITIWLPAAKALFRRTERLLRNDRDQSSLKG